MRYPILSLFLLSSLSLPSSFAAAASLDAIANGLAGHRAVYDVKMVARHSGSQIINVGGRMTYEWHKTCDGWVSDHQFALNYDYAEGPGMRINSDFSTFETLDGKGFDYTARRKRDGELYDDLRGHAELKANGGKAVFTKPEGLKFDLDAGMLYPTGHTIHLVEHALAGDKFYSAHIFDGSDDEGPIEINSFIGKRADSKLIAKGPKIDGNLLGGKAWNVRMAVFPLKDQEEKSDYEMNLVFHENGIISDMLIEYDDFSVTQKLVSLEKIPADSCAEEGIPPAKL